MEENPLWIVLLFVAIVTCSNKQIKGRGIQNQGCGKAKGHTLTFHVDSGELLAAQ